MVIEYTSNTLKRKITLKSIFGKIQCIEIPSTGWNKGWSFLFFLEGGIAKIEAKGFGISITTKVEKGESPLESADRLVSKEQRIRKSRYYSWVKSINEKTIN